MRRPRLEASPASGSSGQQRGISRSRDRQQLQLATLLVENGDLRLFHGTGVPGAGCGVRDDEHERRLSATR